MSKQNIMKYLKEQFGITTERELNAALAKVTPIHIGIMTSKKEVGNSDNTAGVQRVSL